MCLIFNVTNHLCIQDGDVLSTKDERYIIKSDDMNNIKETSGIKLVFIDKSNISFVTNGNITYCVGEGISVIFCVITNVKNNQTDMNCTQIPYKNSTFVGYQTLISNVNNTSYDVFYSYKFPRCFVNSTGIFVCQTSLNSFNAYIISGSSNFMIIGEKIVPVEDYNVRCVVGIPNICSFDPEINVNIGADYDNRCID